MSNRRYWLVKSEPNAYSFDDLQSAPNRIAEWDGIRNFQARNNIQAMKIGDGVLFYHSNVRPNAVVGTATVVKEAYPDHTAWEPGSEHPDPKSTPEKPIWYMVDLKAEALLKSSVSLDAIKKTPSLQNMALVKTTRLSVQPVAEEEWQIVLALGEGS